MLNENLGSDRPNRYEMGPFDFVDISGDKLIHLIGEEAEEHPFIEGLQSAELEEKQAMSYKGKEGNDAIHEAWKDVGEQEANLYVFWAFFSFLCIL